MLLCIEVDQTPVLEETVQTQNTTDIAGNFLAALGARQVGLRILLIQLDNEVTLLEESLRIFVRELAAKELR